jgi:putative transposase
MPRGPRIDAAGAFHHVWSRGIERKLVFRDDRDRRFFLDRLEKACEMNGARVYAWCLIPNHFHLAIRTGERPLSKCMSSLLTSYVMYFNHRHNRAGHLFQNRYKATIVEEERYFLALVRYIHLNPVRARLVETIDALATYSWSGHSALMGKTKPEFQDVDAVLRHFGNRVGTARKALQEFMKMDVAKKEVKTFEGGGLLRSAGGLKKLRELRDNYKWAHDERILGSSSFVESLLKKTEQATILQSPEKRRKAFDELLKRLCEDFGVKKAELLSGSRRRKVSEVRQLLSYGGCRALGLPAAEVGRILNVSGQSILKSAEKAGETWDNLEWLTDGLVE